MARGTIKLRYMQHGDEKEESLVGEDPGYNMEGITFVRVWVKGRTLIIPQDDVIAIDVIIAEN